MSLYYCSCPNHEIFSSFSFSPCFLESLLVGLLGMPLLYVGLRRALKRDLKDRLRDRVSASDSRELLLESPVGEGASGNSNSNGSGSSSGRNGHWQSRARWEAERQSSQLLWIDEEETQAKTWLYRLRVLLQFSLVMLTLAELAFSFSYHLSIPPFHWTFMIVQIILFISYLSLSMGHYLSYFSIYCYSGHGFALLSLWILQLYSRSTENLYEPHIQYPTRFGLTIEILLYILCVLIVALDVLLKGKSRLRLEEEELENGVILIDHESVEEDASIESEDARIERDVLDDHGQHEDERTLGKSSFRFRRSARGRRRSWQAKIALILPYLWPRDDRISQSYVMGALVCLCLGRAVNVLVPIMYKLLIDTLSDMHAVPTPGSSVLGSHSLTMSLCSLLLLFMCLKWMQGSSGALASLQGWLWIRIGQYTTRSISLLVFAHLHRLSLAFHLKRKTGEILRVMDRGTSSIVTLLNNIVFNMLPIMLDIVVASSAFIILFDAWFGYIVLMTMILFTIATMLITERRARLRRLQNELENRATGRAVDSLLNFETVKSFTAEDIESKLYEDSLLAYQWADWLTTSSLYLLNTVQNTIIHLGTGLGALLCLSRLDEGVSSVGDFVLYFTYMSQLYAPIHMLGTYYRSLQQNFIDMEKMLDLMDEPVEIRDRLHARVLTLQQGSFGDIQFENVCFSYGSLRPALRGINFKIPAGQTVALVGPSGGGKSSLLRLLFRFYEPSSGKITIDGVDIRDFTLKSLRSSIGIVPQDTVLFNESIAYNIRYGKVDASIEQVIEAAKAAQIHESILSFPEGYDTMVGERGLRLSGGEKQRIAIARTLLRGPPIIVLDEATSALDSNTERQIQEALRQMTRARSTLIVAHRLSTIVHADCILVLKEGSIVESGTHLELLKIKGLYYELWMKQLESRE